MSARPQGWYLSGSPAGTQYDVQDLDDGRDKEKIYFKSRWIREKTVVNENGTKKTVVIVSYSIKYRDYLRSIRNLQIERAEKLVENGESAEMSASHVDQSVITGEEQYDGFHAVCTNLEDGVESIIKVNKRR